MIRFPFSKPRDPNAPPEESQQDDAQQDDAQQDEARRGDAERSAPPAAEEASRDADWRAEELAVQPLEEAAPFGDRLAEQAEQDRTPDVGTLENPTPGQSGGEDGEVGDDGDGEGEGAPQAAEGAENFARPDMDEQVRMVEAMLFASDKPLSTAELASRMPIGCDAAVAVRRLEEHYAGRGVHLVRVAGKWAFRTAPDLAHLLSDESVEQRKLSRAGIETLAIIAYHQPVTRAEIEEIRQVGVSKGTIDLLMELEWIKLGRRRQTPGRPVTFVTTDKFLEHFGLENVKDLPRLEELRQAGLLDSRPPVGYTPSAGEGFEDDEIEDEEDEDDDDSYGEEDQQDLLM